MSVKAGQAHLHWDGTLWSQVASPNPAGSLVTILKGVSAKSPDDEWAVGSYCSVNCYQDKATPPPRPHTFILRWNGTSWRQVASPNPGGRYGSSLDGVSVLSPHNAWAVGNYGTKKASENFTPGDSLVLHWNGTIWAQQSSPSFGNPAPGSVLYGVSALSPSHALAAGSSYYYNCECVRTLGLRWNSTIWSKVKTPNPGSTTDPEVEFFGISALSPASAWAVGYWETYTNPNLSYLTLVAHWDGTRWTKVPSPSAPHSPNGDVLFAVGAQSATDAWAVGYYQTRNGSDRTLILHWNGTRWTLS